MPQLSEHVHDLEAILAQFISSSEQGMADTRLNIDRLSARIDQLVKMSEEDKQLINQYMQEGELQRQEMNKRWGELANKMGTLVEDIASPGLEGLLVRDFGLDPEVFMRRIRRKSSLGKPGRREFDVVAVSDRFFFLCEVKANPSMEHAQRFVALAKSGVVQEYFPEFSNRSL
ncbi:MAG: hypothetical protein HC842_01810, partial [Cytophagales bacterium]|nr:hypothetical protein [Cytophagales bacterium]